jgi:hypothetical protein
MFASKDDTAAVSERRPRLSERLNMGFIRKTTLVAFAVFVFILPISTAKSQFLFWPQYRSWWDHHAPSRHKHQHRHGKSEVAKNTQSREHPKGPLQIIISIADQRVSVYDDGALIARSSVSTGIARHPTPLGVFSVVSKQRWHRSNIYSGAPMPYMQRITWSGIALHAGVLPGHPASHGCIRLTNDFAIRLWHLTRRGTRVIIAQRDVQPIEITNPHLFTAKVAPGNPEFRAATVAATSIAATAAAHEPLMSNAESQPTTRLQAQDSAAASAAPAKTVPVSIFVSRKLSKLFVRRGFTPLFDVPIRIQNPEQPLGTHVFTAMEFENDGAPIRWNVVSMPDELPGPAKGLIKSGEVPVKQATEAALPPLLSTKANTAFDRIEIPKDAIDRISELVTPASSVIISDGGISHETGKNTDFIVVTH